MNVGFITNSLADLGMNKLQDIANWAYENGFKSLEIGPSIAFDQKSFEQIMASGNLNISAFIYCRNFLSANEEEAALHRAALIERIKMAGRIGVKNIICSTGILSQSFDLSNIANFKPELSVDKVVEVFKPLAEEAEKNNVRIGYENCPLMGNIAISPYMWDILFDKIGSDKIGLVFDPSHFVWQMIDPYPLITQYKDRIFHVHGKDCQVDLQKLKRTGILHSFSDEKEDFSNPHGNFKTLWWRYRLPGLGNLDWNKIVSNLYEIGYIGSISIEHEDPVFGGTIDKVKLGLLKAKKHIESFI